MNAVSRFNHPARLAGLPDNRGIVTYIALPSLAVVPLGFLKSEKNCLNIKAALVNILTVTSQSSRKAEIHDLIT